MSTTRPHPLDFAALTKGSYLEVEQLERATRCKASDHIKFRLKVMSLKAMIEDRTGILSRMEGERLCLMTDAEATIWNLRNACKAFVAVERAGERTALIDENNLTPEQVKTAEVAARAICATANAMKAEQQKHARVLGLLTQPARMIER